ncbi:hypothetical protein Q9247_09655 [Halomonas meridiana]|uniref:hypothetical protein n=1 Tax=Vreelandella aquamarina TaxID=77097 RepID=UPI00273CB4E2|nr:hypothetical protein [Halomonas meridiana]MDP4557947.1 hypothetical protein [Halomonas meridiana]
MSQQFVVVRGQIEEGRKVLAKQGSTFEPRNKEEKERLLSAGVIAPVIESEEELLDDEGYDDQSSDDEQQQPPAQPDGDVSPVKPAPTKRPRK